ncbi:MAG: DUF1844 domain-containing protein [Candidatus Tectomicrobia bacterium]|nr:DUF1844 domain-containing protein [Candidatus Tectomicrobia bacterium]
MPEEDEERKGFTVTDRRLSRRAEEESSEEVRKPKPAAETGTAEAATGRASKGQPQGAAPQMDFSGLIVWLANMALINMGLIPDPVEGKPEIRLDAARQTIDILAILQEKTRGNLDQEEDRLLREILSEVRLRYVEVARLVGSAGRTM